VLIVVAVAALAYGVYSELRGTPWWEFGLGVALIGHRGPSPTGGARWPAAE
jgi:hypothetical protein